MPVQACTTTVNGESRPGRRWGTQGKCYPCAPDGDCADAEAKAAKQGRAAEADSLRRRVHPV